MGGHYFVNFQPRQIARPFTRPGIDERQNKV